MGFALSIMDFIFYLYQYLAYWKWRRCLIYVKRPSELSAVNVLLCLVVLIHFTVWRPPFAFISDRHDEFQCLTPNYCFPTFLAFMRQQLSPLHSLHQLRIHAFLGCIIWAASDIFSARLRNLFCDIPLRRYLSRRQ